MIINKKKFAHPLVSKWDHQESIQAAGGRQGICPCWPQRTSRHGQHLLNREQCHQKHAAAALGPTTAVGELHQRHGGSLKIPLFDPREIRTEAYIPDFELTINTYFRGGIMPDHYKRQLFFEALSSQQKNAMGCQKLEGTSEWLIKAFKWDCSHRAVTQTPITWCMTSSASFQPRCRRLKQYRSTQTRTALTR